MDEVKPEWMLKTGDGEIYEDNKGFNWMDPWNKEVKEYLIEVALGCKEAGFDEVQYDYVRFPTGITEEDLGYNGYQRRRAIYEFVRDAHAPLKKEGMRYLWMSLALLSIPGWTGTLSARSTRGSPCSASTYRL